MTTETTTETTQAPAATGSTTWYTPSVAEFSAMTPDERTAALERTRSERAAYDARKGQAPAQTSPATPRSEMAGSPFEFTTDPEIHGMRTKVGQAQATFEREQKALYRGDGTPRYSPAEHSERLAALHADFDRTIGDVQQTAEGLIARHTTTLQHIEQGDPLDALTTAEKTAATQSATFIKEDAQTLPASELVTRCQVALQMGEKPTLYLLARYVGARVQAAAAAHQVGVAQAAIDRAGHYLGGPVDAASVAGTTGQASGAREDLTLAERQELGELVTQMRAAVRGTAGAQKAEATRTKLQTALALKATARTAYAIVHDTQGRMEAEMLASGRYSL